MPGASITSINAKRARVSPGMLRKRIAAGETLPENTRASIRVGTMTTRILTGQEDLSVWSDEELVRGQRKSKNGRWQGKKPVVVPKALHDELVRRTLSRANELLRENLVAAVEVLMTLINGKDVDDKVRVKAVEMIMDRVMGKEPQKVEMSGEAKWQVAINAGIISIPGAGDEQDFMDADSTEEDE